MSARIRLALTALLLLFSGGVAQQPAVDLTGLWTARLRFGPDVRGPVTLVRDRSGWGAELAGFSVPVRAEGDRLGFELPDGNGSFRGRIDGRRIVGHWIQPRTQQSTRAYATPTGLDPIGPGIWRGTIGPMEDESTLFLPVSRQGSRTYRTFLRDIELNRGWFRRVGRLEHRGDSVLLVDAGGGTGMPLYRGTLDDAVLRIPIDGWTYDFRRTSDSISAFYPRGRGPSSYRYRPPPPLGDGWPVATVEEVGIERSTIERFVRMLMDLSMDSISSHQVHSVLIARHGKLVVEEYFHGHSREAPHDLRSAAKSWVAVLTGAAIEAGIPIGPETPVYETMARSGYPIPAGLDPRKRAMRLEHLLSMTAGYDCGRSDSPANETVMQQQAAEPDWLRYTLNAPLATAPGDTIVYCDAEPNLAAGMLRAIAGEPLPELFRRLVADPLRMGSYHLQLTPTGEAYGGGGHRFTSRDYLKLVQLMLNEGEWNGKRILSRQWARRSGTGLRNLSRTQQYGWLWNVMRYPHRGDTVPAFFAGGNGGQIFMGIPKLGLAIGFTGGNYGDPVLFRAQRMYVPELLLPGVRP